MQKVNSILKVILPWVYNKISFLIWFSYGVLVVPAVVYGEEKETPFLYSIIGTIDATTVVNHSAFVTNGTSVTLTGKNTNSQEVTMFYYRHETYGMWDFVTKVDVSALKQGESRAGLMARMANHSESDYCSVTIDGNGKVFFRKRIAGQEEIIHEWTVPDVFFPGVKIRIAGKEEISHEWTVNPPYKYAYLLARLEDGTIRFYLGSSVNPNDSSEEKWIQVGETTYWPKSYYFGLCLQPKPNTIFSETAAFSEIQKRGLTPEYLAKTGLARGIDWGKTWRWIANPIGTAIREIAGDDNVVSGILDELNPLNMLPSPIPGMSVNDALELRSGEGVKQLVDILIPNIPGAPDMSDFLDFAFKPMDNKWKKNTTSTYPEFEVYHEATGLLNAITAAYNSPNFEGSVHQMYYNDLETMISRGHNSYIGSSELDKINRSGYNAEVYIADIIRSHLTGTPRKYSTDQFKLYHGFNLGKQMQEVRSASKACAEAITPDWEDFFTAGVDNIFKGVGCFEKLTSLNIGVQLESLDDYLMDGAAYIAHLGLLAALDSNYFYEYNTLRHQMLGDYSYYLNFVGKDVYNGNNIPMKGLAALALNEIPHSLFLSLNRLNIMAEEKFSSGGGYAEGTDYLDWLNRELLPLCYVGNVCQWFKGEGKEPLPQIAKSGKWLLDIMDHTGFIPAVDDATGVLNFWLAPYATLCSDPRFLAYTKYGYFERTLPSGTNEPNMTVLHFLTIPPGTPSTGPLSLAPIVSSEGVSKINYSEGGGGNVSLTLIAENGSLLSAGGSHDQADNTSICVNRSEGFKDDWLVIDPGYAGFDKKGKEAYNEKHNTVRVGNQCVTHNPKYTAQDIISILKGMFPEWALSISAGSPILNALTRIVQLNIDLLKGAAGGSATVAYQGLNSVTVKQSYDYGAALGDYNERTVARFGDDLIIFDHIHSEVDDYTLRLNVPETCSEHIQGSPVYEVEGDSSISRGRISIFSEDMTNMMSTAVPDNFDHRENGKGATKVTAIEANANSSYAGNSFWFMTTIEPRDWEYTFNTNQAYVSVVGASPEIATGVSVCARQELADANLVRYVFCNKYNPDGSKSQVRLLAAVNQYSGFVTDADCGIMQFNTASQTLCEVLLFNATYAYYNGKSVQLPGILLHEVRLVNAGNGVISIEYPGTTVQQTSPCFLPKRLILEGFVTYATESYLATEAIIVRNVIFNYGASITLTAGQEVLVEPNFEAKKGSNVKFIVDPKQCICSPDIGNK